VLAVPYRSPCQLVVDKGTGKGQEAFAPLETMKRSSTLLFVATLHFRHPLISQSWLLLLRSQQFVLYHITSIMLLQSPPLLSRRHAARVRVHASIHPLSVPVPFPLPSSSPLQIPPPTILSSIHLRYIYTFQSLPHYLPFR